jgi:chromosome segregation ATPase
MALALMRRSRSTVADHLERAREALAETNRQLAELGERREAALLSDDDGEIEPIDRELDHLERVARTQADRVRLLERQAANEDAARQSKRRQEHIARIEQQLAEADKIAGEVQRAAGQYAASFRRLVDLRREIAAAWNWSTNEIDLAALSAAAVVRLLAAELYRVAAAPVVAGDVVGRCDLPGAACPDVTLALEPDKITPFAVAIRDASAHAISIMKS